MTSRVAVLIALLAAPSVAQAQTEPVRPDATRAAEARSLFERALTDLDARRYTPAMLLLDESYRLNPVPVVLYNLGLAHRALGHHRAAIEHFELYLQQSGGDLPEGREAAVRAVVAQLRGDLATVRFEVTPAAFTVTVDGRDAATDDGALSLDPGAHTVAVAARGHVGERRELRLSPSERYVFQATLRAEPTPHPRAPEARSITTRWWFWTAVGVVVAAGVATALAVALSSTEGPVPGTRINVEAITLPGR